MFKEAWSMMQLQLTRLALRLRSVRTPESSRFGVNQPGFMILGIQKGGTTWLASELDAIPGLQLSRPKETRLFNVSWRARYGRWSDKKLRAYYLGKHWPTATADQILFEASPGYLASQAAAHRIARYFPASRFVVLLREPAGRAFSNYNMWVRNRGISETFRDIYKPQLERARAAECEYTSELDFYGSISQSPEQQLISHGLYYYHLRIWFSLFPREQFFITTTPQLRSPDMWGGLLRFLGVDPSLARHASLEREYWDRHRGAPMNGRDAAELAAFYEPYNAKLFKLLGVADLDW